MRRRFVLAKIFGERFPSRNEMRSYPTFVKRLWTAPRRDACYTPQLLRNLKMCGVSTLLRSLPNRCVRGSIYICNASIKIEIMLNVGYWCFQRDVLMRALRYGFIISARTVQNGAR